MVNVISAERSWGLKAALFLVEKGSAHLASRLKPVSAAERKRRLILCITRATGPSHLFQFQWWVARSSGGARKSPNLKGGLGRLLHSSFHTHFSTPPLLSFFPPLSFFFFNPSPKKRQIGLHASCYCRPRDLWDWCFGRLMVIWGVAVGLTKCLFSSLSFSWLPPPNPLSFSR